MFNLLGKELRRVEKTKMHEYKMLHGRVELTETVNWIMGNSKKVNFGAKFTKNEIL